MAIATRAVPRLRPPVRRHVRQLAALDSQCDHVSVSSRSRRTCEGNFAAATIHSRGRAPRYRREARQDGNIDRRGAAHRHRGVRRCAGAGERRSDAVARRRRRLYRRSQGRHDRSGQAENPFRPAQHGHRPGRVGPPGLRPSPPADRHQAAAPQPAHPQRLQPSAFRRRPDRGRDHAQAGPAHAAAADGRQGPRSPHAAGDVAAHSGPCRRRAGRPGGGERRSLAVAAGRRGLLRRAQGRRGHRSQDHHPFRLEEHGRRARRLGSPEFRPSSSLGRHRAAAARSADPQRLQPSPFRRRPDPGRGHAQARRA